MPLIPCPSCRRHVRAGDESCPFCASAMPADARAVPALNGRLGRGALFAFAVSVAACGGSTESDTTTDSGAATDSGATDTGTAKDTAVEDTGGPVAAYGGPPDTGLIDTGTTDAGADVRDSGGPAPAYGLPPSDGG